MLHGLDEIEDAIEGVFGCAGEVTGTGAGAMGSNFDIEISDESLDSDAVLTIVRNVLSQFRLPKASVIVIEGVEYPLYVTGL